MKNKSIYHGFGLLAFLVAIVTYLLTVQPGVPFWDCGEFSAASIWQQVPHPPGAPLFLMVGKVFHTLIPFGDDGWRINLVSVFSTAFSVWLIYLITVKVIWNFRKENINTFADELAVYGSAFVGALALIYSDTVWFNAVESEVYAASMVFVAIIIFLMMRWNEEADNPGHERYLLLIAYIIGLSTGVHLLSILTIFSIVLLVYFRKYEYSLKSFLIMGIIAVVVFGIIYPGIVKWVPAMLNGTLLFKNECQEYLVQDAPIISVFIIGVIVFAAFMLWYSHKRKWEIVKLVTTAFLLMIVGYSTYTQILLRSNANPPMNENEPKDLHSLTSYLGREQYGDAPMWPRRYQTEDYYVEKFTKKDKNDNYVYGEWNPPVREEVRCKDETKMIALPKFKETNFSGEITFLWKYQIYHMYIRYFLWNYMGRTSDIQDSPEAFDGKKEAEFINYKSGYSDIYPIRFWAIPLLFGFFGLFFHFWRDPKMAFVYLIMFLLMGVLATLQQNQQEPQPRERDYFYTGSFIIWCMWIAMGVYFLIDWISKKEFKAGVVASIVIVSILIVPVNMAYAGWKMHSRAGNHLPFDYSYNILQSCEKDAILFTNGDNDTFPLWYLQDVMGVRRDIRIVNLSLGNTLWYIHQLKNRSPWGAKPIPLSFDNASLTVAEDDPTALSYDFGKAQEVTIPVPRDVMAKYTNDPALLVDPKMTFTFLGKPYGERDGQAMYLFRVQDKLILDILQQINWKRPIYFSTTVGGDAYSGLESFFRIEGMVQRVCPVPQRSNTMEALDEKIMTACLMNIDNSDSYHKEPHFGMKLRNLSNPNVFYDEVHRRLMINYRSLYSNFAAYYLQEGKDKKMSVAILDTMNKYISPVQFPMPYELEYRMARIYSECGEDGKIQAEKWANITLKSCLELIKNPELQPDSRQYGMYSPHRIAAYMYEIKKDYGQAKQILQQLLGNLQQAFESIKGNQAYQEDAQRIYYTMYDVQTNLDELQLSELEAQGKVQEAIKKGEELLKTYTESPDQNINYFSRNIQMRLDAIRKKHGLQAPVSTIDSNKQQ